MVVLALLADVAHAATLVDEVHYTITGQTSVTFDWRSPTAENVIRYGTSPGAYTASVVGATPSPVPISSSGPFWEARLEGLGGNTTYYYQIGAGPERTFKTPVPRGSAGFTVIAQADIGDTGRYPNMGLVQDQVASLAPTFVLAAGDLTYGNAHGQAAVDQHFNDVMRWSQGAAYMPAWGNHEWDVPAADDLRNYKSRFDLPNAQTSPGSPAVSCCGEDWSWFDYGNTRFISYPEPWSGAWSDWRIKAANLMAAAQADPDIAFVVTFGHRPAYSSGHHSGESTLAGHLNALGQQYRKYVLNINGHSHDYERTYPQYGVVHVTAGTGGANLEQDGACLWKTCAQPSWSAKRYMHLGLVKLTFMPDAIKGEFICGPAGSGANDISCSPGQVVDTFLIGTAGSGNTPPAVAVTAPAAGATVSGTVTVAAEASDDVGIAGVQFLLDGMPLGAEDTAAPYEVPWNTATARDGPHTLAAVARDTSNSTTTSSSVSVAVSNTAGTQTRTFAPADDARITAASASSNFGRAAALDVDSSPSESFLIKFVISGVGSATVKSAKLRFYNVNSSNRGGDFYAAASNAWSEGTVTWNTAPAIAGSPVAALGAVSSGQSYDVDLMPLITGDGTYSVRATSSSSDGADYRSKEATTASQRPVLTITF